MAPPVEPRPFSGLSHSAGELLRTPEQMPASMATAQLSIWDNTFYLEVADVFESLTAHKFEPFLPSLLTNVAH
jgi:hypothetical protein